MGHRQYAWALLSCFAIACAGCGGPSAEERLVGKWKGQVELNEEAVTKELSKTGDGSNAKLVFEALESMEVDIEFKADGSLSMSAAAETPSGADSQSVTGKWKVVSQQGDQITITSIHDGEEEAEEIDIKLEGDDAFSTRPPGPNHEIGVLRMRRLR